MKRLMKFWIVLLALCFSVTALAVEADLKANSPAITALKQSMRARRDQLRTYLDSGAVGITSDGMFAVRDASSVPLPERQTVNSLVAAENQDRNALYIEIARVNGHPEWQAEIGNVFAQRWMEHAHPGWWIQQGGVWKQK